MTDLHMGIYRHYKGPLYQVLGLVHDANDPARTAVAYLPLQLDPTHLGPQLTIRTLEDFTAYVVADPEARDYGQVHEFANRRDVISRFRYLGPVVTADMFNPPSPRPPKPTGGPGDHGVPPFPGQLVPTDPDAPKAGPAGGWHCEECGSKLWVYAVSSDGTHNAPQCVGCGVIGM